MKPEALRRLRVPLGLGLLLLAVWVGAGIRRVADDDRAAVLDSPLGLLNPRPLAAGWHFAPPGILRISRYPVGSATLSFEVGGEGLSLISSDGIQILALGTIRYRVDPEELLEVHRALGPRLESEVLEPWIVQGLRAGISRSSYTDISGARSEQLRSDLARALAERFRGAGLVLLSCDIADVRIHPGEERGSVARPIPGMKVLLLGLDGADWNILDPLFEQGKLPNLKRLASGGVRGRLRSITPMLSPVIWTSVATGVVPSRHGIVDFLATTGREGERVPVTSTLRQVKAVWNILNESGLSVGVVGWWASYPAEAVDGFMVSDRVAYQLFRGQVAHREVRRGRVYPPDLDELVLSLTIDPGTVSAREVSRYIREPREPASLSAEDGERIEDFKTLLAAGDTYMEVSLALEEQFRPAFHAFYLEGTDTIAHLFMPYAPPPLEGIDPEGQRMFGRAVERYYQHADEMVGRLVEAAAAKAVIVCSDHGLKTGDNRPLTDARIGYGAAADWHRKYGVIILHGEPFRAGHVLQETSVLDITPTVLALFGLPIGDDMDGRPILDAFDPDFLRAHPIGYIPTYEGAALARTLERSTAPPPSDPVGDAERVEKLRSLGYLRQDTPNAHNNRGMLLLSQNRHDEAIREFELAIEGSEDLSIARINIARAHFAKRDYAAAEEALRELRRRQPLSKEAENLLGNIDMERGDLQAAETHFKRALEMEPNSTDARNSLGILYNRMGRRDEALREFQRVIQVDADYAEAHNNIGVIFKSQGRMEEAVAAFRRAISADPEFSGSYSNLAIILEENGDLEEAEKHFRRAIRRDPNNVAVRTNYGGLLYKLERFEEARLELEKAIELDPDYASAHNNLGAVYGRLGRGDDEIAAYRRAVALNPDYADVHHNLGLALLKQRRFDEGESELRHALEIDPGYGPAYVVLGGNLLGLGKAAEAADLLLVGAREVPGEVEIHRLLGESYRLLDRRQDAAAAFGKALQLQPDRSDIRQRLESMLEKVDGEAPSHPPGDRG